jgi:hypothetical protein
MHIGIGLPGMIPGTTGEQIVERDQFAAGAGLSGRNIFHIL